MDPNILLGVLSALRSRLDDKTDDYNGWTPPITVAQAIGVDVDRVLGYFLVLADDGYVDLNRTIGGLSTMAKINVHGLARLANLSEDARSAATTPHPSPVASHPLYKFDAFISHASEDASEFADGLVDELKARGLEVWYDRDRIGYGDQAVDRMNAGIRDSRCGVIIASPHYFTKAYTKPELNAFINLFANDENRKIVPILFGMTQAELRRQHPMLATHTNIEAKTWTRGQIADFIARALDREGAMKRARLADQPPVARDLQGSPYSPGEHDPPYDALPEQPHLLSVRPKLEITWFEPRVVAERATISWQLVNVGAGPAREIAVFLPGIASYAAGDLPNGKSVDVQRRFDDRYAYYQNMKPPLQAIVESSDVHGNVYRQYAGVQASFKWHDSPADYHTTQFGHPYPVSGRIVQVDIATDRFFLSGPLGNPW